MDDRDTARKIFTAALAAVDPHRALAPHLDKVREAYDSGGFTRLVVVGFGKGGLPMALAAEESLGEEISSGAVIVPRGSRPRVVPQRIEVLEGSHPHPDQHSVEASRRIVELVKGADERTLLLVLISGGGSALFTMPAPGITLEEKAATARLLMEASADITELNTVRKHLSAVKGGQLAALAHPARQVVLAVSDVPGDRLDVIASGPAYPDPTTFADALAVLERRGVLDRVPAAVRERLSRGAEGLLPETPKPGDPLFAAVSTTMVAANRQAREAAAAEARRLGVEARILDEDLCGEARLAGKRLAGLARRERSALDTGRKLCLISGGETTVKVVGTGKGGRNQEVALAFAMEVAGEPGLTLLSAGTDGIDGPTDAAGAVVDGGTAERAREAGLDAADFLDRNDAYALLEPCDALMKTGPTGTNVMDLQILVVSG